ncbi:MAG: undecaprenyl/decaprenyl-phosphate alpha-N-acetylglucosaminyl 1-phosphate transferase [Acidobacteriota bacterium]|nr:undecaprenyl/decaprenyl-phosphate alpha-N-acetylglucosaminyl 1-phosphate transferase [Acidobacteriota bacterium]
MLAGLVSLAAALLLTPLAIVVGRRVGAEDRPGPLKPHVVPVPYLGGAAVFVAVLPWLIADDAVLLAPLGAALVLGLVDDRRGLRPALRLAVQVAIGAALAVVLGTRVPGPGGGVLVVVVTVLLVNGVNLVDGLDGLAPGVAAVACLGSSVLLGGAPRALAAAGAGSLVGFLAYNRPPARVYLGDGGAYFLGALLTVLLASAWAPSARWSTSAAALLLVAVPAAEVAFAVARRLGAGRSVTGGDRRHPYDLVVARGWPVWRASAAYVATSAVLAAVAIAVARLDSVGGAVAAAVLAAGGLVGLALACGALSPGEQPAP